MRNRIVSLKKLVSVLVVMVLLSFSLLQAFAAIAPITVEVLSPITFNQVPLGVNITIGIVTVEYDVKVSNASSNVVLAVVDSSVKAAAFSELPAVVRFGVNGTIDVRNTDNYVSTVEYVENKNYHIKMEINIDAKTFDVTVDNVKVAEKFGYRKGSNELKNVGNFVYESEAGTGTITNLKATAAAAATTATTAPTATTATTAPTATTATTAPAATVTPTKAPATAVVAPTKAPAATAAATTTETENSKTNSLVIISVVLLVIALGVIGFIVVKKGKK